MEFQPVYLPQVRSIKEIKDIVEKLSDECDVSFSADFTTIKYGLCFRKGDDCDCPTKTKLFDALNAAQVPFMELVQCIQYLRHYVPGMPFGVHVVNTNHEKEPWMFVGLILITKQTKFVPTEGLNEFINRFRKAKENVGKQIKLFRSDSSDSYTLELIDDPGSLIA